MNTAPKVRRFYCRVTVHSFWSYLSKYTYTENVKFRPWVGERYCEGAPWRFRAMVLGESHYDTDNNSGEERAEFTKLVVGRVVRGEDQRYRTRLFTKTARLFLMAAEEDEWAARATCREFWNDVSFYNFVQEYVGREPRDRPTRESWGNSESAFEEVVRKHRPDLIVVLGNTLWQKLLTCRTKVRGSHIAFVEIKHPQAFGWSYEKWMPPLRDSIGRARRQK